MQCCKSKCSVRAGIALACAVALIALAVIALAGCAGQRREWNFAPPAQPSGPQAVTTPATDSPVAPIVDGASQVLAAAQQAKADLAAMREKALADIAAAQAAQDAKAEQEAARREQTIAQAQSELNRAIGVIAQTPDGAVDLAGTATGLAVSTGQPLIALLGVLGAAGWGFYERRRKQQAEQDAMSIVYGIDAARAADPTFKTAMRIHKAEIEKHLTAGARRRIKEGTVT